MEISNNTPRKIAYIITLSDLGGAQSHVYEVIRNIGEYGYAPILITGAEGWLTERATSRGIICHIVSDLVRPIAPIHDFKAVREVKRILQEEQPVLVHCHSSKAGIIGRIAAHSCNIPAIFTAHGWAFTDGVNPIKRRLYAWIENMAAYLTDRIICVSEYDRNLGIKYLPHHKEKMVTIHNCILDMPQFVRDWNKHPVGDVLNIIVVARFSTPKKNKEILRCLRNMLDIGLKITVTFVGDGPQWEQAKAEAKKLHLGGKAIFLGPRTDVAELLPKYDMFLLLSNWEGFPISILEAMRAGIPILASDVGGVKEAVRHRETGFLLENDSDIEKYIQQCFGNDSEIKEMGKNGRLRFIRYFKDENMMLQVVTCYRRIESSRCCHI
ncbi:glycosyltransferase family 4 protein [Selenomonas ruminantium]|uniref:Glycosyltransferase involved in cell wall bisynthesis n=1 Tax=Selenomonas ruminantium TaxID=971 RepID=A0A1I0XHW8_SELRU|nr:glycosyltransferase family 4 protein [Selenomonas ruminantium]SFB00635.1 Glycosyltransferase involved in cell wall bisynthesis [Selenomonas ruminantium]